MGKTMKNFIKALWDRPERMVAIAAIVGTVFIVYEIRDRGKELKNQTKNIKIQSKIYTTQAFSRAIEQLGSKQVVTQLGTIHSLEKLAEDSNEYYWPIMQVLASYCKESDIDSNIQEALDVFVRRKYHYGIGIEENKKFDLSGARLDYRKMEKINLEGAILSEANLYKSTLREANLIGVNFKDAYLEEAYLEEADLSGAHLERANLNGAHLTGAILRKANIWNGKFKGARLNKAVLEGAFLKGAVLVNANLESANLKDASFKYANLDGATLSKANLVGVNFKHANLEKVNGLTIKQLSKVKTLFRAKLNPALLKQVKRKYPHLLEMPKDAESAHEE